MYYLALDKKLQITGVSTRLKAEMQARDNCLKGCFFLSMVDSEVPDELADDLTNTLELGLIYNAVLHINVFKQPIWQEVTITRQYENGDHIGYLAKLVDTNGSDLKITCSVYKKIKHGELSILNGFPVSSHYRKRAESNKKSWLKRVK